MSATDGTRSAVGKRAGPTIYEVNDFGGTHSARELPRLVTSGVGIVWHSARRELLALLVLEVLTGVGTAAQVVVGRQALAVLLDTQHDDAGFADVWPAILVLAVVTAVVGLAGMVLFGVQRMMNELTSRYAQDRILDVT